MTREDLLKRCIRVIQSCVTDDQVNSAINYCNLALKQTIMKCDINPRIQLFMSLERAIAVTQYKILINEHILTGDHND